MLIGGVEFSQQAIKNATLRWHLHTGYFYK